MGETARESEAKRISKGYGALGRSVDTESGFDVFKDFEPQYGLEDFRGAADTVYDKNVSNIGRLTKSNVAESTGRSAQSLASRGITGGSVVDDARSRIEGDIYGKQFDALENLGISRAGQETGFLDMMNRLDVTGKKGFLESLMAKYGIKSGALRGQTTNLGGFSDDTWFDDILAIGNTAAGFIPGGGTTINL